MGLMNCGDCNAPVSSDAAACPRCNAPPHRFRLNSVRRARPYLIATGSALGGSLLTIVALVAYGLHRAPVELAEDATNVQTEAFNAVRDAARGRPNFVTEHDGEYGYQLASDKAGSNMMFIRYLGTREHVTRFAEMRPDKTMMFSCEGTCDQVTVGQYLGGRVVGQTKIDVVGGSLLYAVIEDIVQGRVQVYKAPKS